ncbi:MAG: hypothetical protein IKP40_08910 [Clostridia bacterium]|nr:hypothetical protein [Clostridia bacterium]
MAEQTMPLEPYKYPDVLYCDKCRQDVDVRIVDRTTTYENHESGEVFTVPYKAAVCPACGNTLCERDQEYAFVNLASRWKGEQGA